MNDNIFDDQNNADKAYDAAKTIANLNRHVAVIGHHYSSCSIRAGKIYQDLGIAAISPASTNIQVTRNNQWYFRTIFNDYLQSIYLAIYVKEVLDKKQVSIIQEDQNYGAYLGKVFEDECRRSGLSIAFKRTFKVEETDQDKRIMRIVNDLKKQKDTDIIFLALHCSEGIKFVKAIKDNGIEIPIITPDAFASKTFQKSFEKFPEESECPGYYTNGIYVITPIIFDTANEDAQQFWNQYIQQYGKEPGWHAAFAYDTAKVLYFSMLRCIDPDNRKSLMEEIVWNRVFIHLKRAKINLAMQRHRIYMTSDVPIEEDESVQSINLLKDIELFKHFSKKDQTFISQRIKHHHYRASQTIVRQGDDGDSLYIIVEGVVTITLTVEGREIEIGRLGAENIFGEMALLTGKPRSANVVSLTETYLLEISKQDIAPIIEAQPEISALLGEVLVLRNQKTKSILENMESSETQDDDLPRRIVSKILHYFGVKLGAA